MLKLDSESSAELTDDSTETMLVHPIDFTSILLLFSVCDLQDTRFREVNPLEP